MTNTSWSPSYSCFYVWSWHTHTVIDPAQSRAPLITCPSLRSLIHLVAASLLLFHSTSLPAHLMPQATRCHLPLNFHFQLISLYKAQQGGSLSHLWRQALCQGTCTCQWVQKKKKRREGERGGGCIVPILCLHTEGYWVQTLESELQADRRDAKQHKKNKCRKPKHKGSNCTTWSRQICVCIVWNAYLASGLYVLSTNAHRTAIKFCTTD